MAKKTTTKSAVKAIKKVLKRVAGAPAETVSKVDMVVVDSRLVPDQNKANPGVIY